MASSSQAPKPTLALQQQSSQTELVDHTARVLDEQQHMDGRDDYDPCENAQKFSPFYQYNHDSPRPSTDVRPKQSLHVSIRDLELGEITPSVTQEKIAAHKPRRKFTEKLKFWERKQECLTRPKKQWWLQRLPKKQRIAVRALIALIVAGTMVGIAVGIASALNSGINGSDKTVPHPQ